MTSGNVTPSLALHDEVNGAAADSKSSCNRGSCLALSMRQPNLTHIVLDQPRTGTRLASAWQSALLPYRVLAIVPVTSLKEMRRIATRRVVAAMERTFWPFAMCEVEGKPVSKNLLPLELDVTIARGDATPCPEPTSIRPAGFVEATPEPLFNRLSLGDAGTCSRAVAMGESAPAVLMVALKLRAADFAGKLKGHVDLLSRVPRRGLFAQVPGLFVPTRILPKTAQPRHFWGSEVVACL